MSICIKCGIEIIVAINVARKRTCIDCKRKYKRIYARLHPQKYENTKEAKKHYYEKNREVLIDKAKTRYQNDKESKRTYDVKRRKDKPNLYRESRKCWIKNHPGLKNADTQTRRARLRSALPKWANKFFISEIYNLAALRTKTIGFRWVVDHVIPLRGKFVSSLHVENNLCVIPEKINLKKSNHFSLEWQGVR